MKFCNFGLYHRSMAVIVALLCCNLTFAYVHSGQEEPINTPTEVSSPDGKNTAVFSLIDGKTYYEILRNGKNVINRSPLGMEARDSNIGSNFSLQAVTFDSKDEAWTQPWGENKNMREHYNEMAVKLVNADTELTIRFRAFDDGLGFRFEYNVLNTDSVYVTEELTQFAIAEDGTAWAIAANGDSYEYIYGRNPISQTREANTPMTFRTNSKVYASIHEAALYDFPEMTLWNIGETTFQATLDSWPDGIKAKKTNNFSTSWRTIQLGDQAIDLINSGLILNLNEPSKIEDTDWIEPMKYIGVWWGIHTGIYTWEEGPRHGATTERAKEYIDFAQENNIRGVLFEGWNKGWEASVPSEMSPESYYYLTKLPGNGQWFDGATEYKIANYFRNGEYFNIEVSLDPQATEYTHYVTPYSDGSSIPELTDELSLSIYPTAVQDHLTISAGQPGLSITIFSLTGLPVQRIRTEDTTVSLNITALPKGIYFVQVIQNEKSTTRQIIKR